MAISKINIGGTEHEIVAGGVTYCTCDTAAATVAKVAKVVSGNFTLFVGARVIIKFTKANSAANPTLTIVDADNNTLASAKSILRYGTTAISTGTTSSGWIDGAMQAFTYDGTSWVQDYWYNSTYSNASLGQGYATCSTAESTVAKAATLSSYSLAKGGIVAVKFTYAVPANATLNINSKGAKRIYYRGSAITVDIIKAGDIATFIYDGTQYHLISIDRWQEDLNGKMYNSNPTGTGSFSLNRKDGSTIGNYSFAEGRYTTASGDYSHAEGYTNTASGDNSHAEGANNTASGMSSHAEGYANTASGNSSHTEGSFNTASAYNSHAEGWGTNAIGAASHAEGSNTTANSYCQHVQGEYNILDTENVDARGTYAHIVGNGTNGNPSNAHTLDWSGNAWFQGDVYVGSTSGTNKDSGSVKLATEEYVDNNGKGVSITIPKGRMRGDIDGDGKITSNDAELCTQHYNGTPITDTVALWCADTNNNGSINATDSLQITRCVSGKTSALTTTPTLADYYNNWTYNKVDDLTGYFYTDIAISGMTASSSAIVVVQGDFEENNFIKAECLAGKIRICAKLCPIAALKANVQFFAGDGTAVIIHERVTPSDNSEIFYATFGSTTIDEMDAAINSGKTLFVKYVDDSAGTYVLPLINHSQGFYAFSTSNSSICVVALCMGNTWACQTYDTDKVFIATYGTTTHADILAAVQAGKVCFCDYSGSLTTTHLAVLEYCDSSGATFTVSSGSTITYYKVSSSNSWTYNNVNLVPTSGCTMSGGLVAANGNITVKQVRNIYAGTSDMTAGTSTLATGDIYIVYE